jgi:hypothetical protein
MHTLSELALSRACKDAKSPPYFERTEPASIAPSRFGPRFKSGQFFSGCFSSSFGGFFSSFFGSLSWFLGGACAAGAGFLGSSAGLAAGLGAGAGFSAAGGFAAGTGFGAGGGGGGGFTAAGCFAGVIGLAASSREFVLSRAGGAGVEFFAGCATLFGSRAGGFTLLGCSAALGIEALWAGGAMPAGLPLGALAGFTATVGRTAGLTLVFGCALGLEAGL